VARVPGPWHGTAVSDWTIVEIETAAPGWRTSGNGDDDGAPVAVWALVENGTGERFVVGIDPTAADADGRLIDVGRLVDRAGRESGGYTYRAPLS
jgi:hypothetical protein